MEESYVFIGGEKTSLSALATARKDGGQQEPTWSSMVVLSRVLVALALEVRVIAGDGPAAPVDGVVVMILVITAFSG